MRIFAENARIARIETFGPEVAPPGGPGFGFARLVSLTVPAGKVALVDLVQALTLNPTTTVLSRVVAGLSWRAQVTDLAGANPQTLPLDPDGGDIRWTFLDGQPAVRNVLVTPARRLVWGAVVTGALPGSVTQLVGGIRGYLFDADALTEEQLIGLLAKS